MTIANLDADLRNADWTKQTWDLPTSPDFYVLKYGPSLPDFAAWMKTLPVFGACPPVLRAFFDQASKIMEGKSAQRHVRDSAYWGAPVGTPLPLPLVPEPDLTGWRKLKPKEVVRYLTDRANVSARKKAVRDVINDPTFVFTDEERTKRYVEESDFYVRDNTLVRVSHDLFRERPTYSSINLDETRPITDEERARIQPRIDILLSTVSELQQRQPINHPVNVIIDDKLFRAAHGNGKRSVWGLSGFHLGGSGVGKPRDEWHIFPPPRDPENPSQYDMPEDILTAVFGGFDDNFTTIFLAGPLFSEAKGQRDDRSGGSLPWHPAPNVTANAEYEVRATVVHEWGHVFPVSPLMWRDERARLSYEEAVAALKDDMTHVSRYAQKNQMEAAAESFSAWFFGLHGSKDKDAPKIIADAARAMQFGTAIKELLGGGFTVYVEDLMSDRFGTIEIDPDSDAYLDIIGTGATPPSESKTMHVATPAGVRRYGAPIGTPLPLHRADRPIVDRAYRGIMLDPYREWGPDGPTDDEVRQALRESSRGHFFGPYWSSDPKVSEPFASGDSSQSLHWWMSQPEGDVYGVVLEAGLARQASTSYSPFVYESEKGVESPLPEDVVTLTAHLYYRVPNSTAYDGERVFVRDIDIPISKGRKELQELIEVKGVRRVRDPYYWGLPYNTIITPGMKPRTGLPEPPLDEFGGISSDGKYHYFRGLWKPTLNADSTEQEILDAIRGDMNPFGGGHREKDFAEADGPRPEYVNRWPMYGQYWSSDPRTASDFATNEGAVPGNTSGRATHRDEYGVILEAISDQPFIDNTRNTGYTAESQVKFPPRDKVEKIKVYLVRMPAGEPVSRMKAGKEVVRSFDMPDEKWKTRPAFARGAIISLAVEPEGAVVEDSWRDVPFDADPLDDINSAMYEPNPPAKLYHVAPRSARERILKDGLDATGHTWNVGASEGWHEDEFNWTESDEGEKFPYEYRPTAVYMFEDLDSAREYSRGVDDIYEIDIEANGREVIRDPSQASNWDYIEEFDRAYATRYVEPSALKIVSNVNTARDPDAPVEGEWVRDADGSATAWRQDHDVLVRDGLQSWMGAPADMKIHMADELIGAPQPSSGTGKKWRAQAAALLSEIRANGKPIPKRLYRGDYDNEWSGKDTLSDIPSTWSESSRIARGFAKQRDGVLHTLEPGQGIGIRIADYLPDDGMDKYEKQWLVIDDATGLVPDIYYDRSQRMWASVLHDKDGNAVPDDWTGDTAVYFPSKQAATDYAHERMSRARGGEISAAQEPPDFDALFNDMPPELRDTIRRLSGVPGTKDKTDPNARKRKRLGNCYEFSAQYLWAHEDAVLVHGTIQGMGNPPLFHAWVENYDGTVFEPGSGHVMSQEDFDWYFNPVVEDTYTVGEANNWMRKTGHYGPWEGSNVGKAPMKGRGGEVSKATEPMGHTVAKLPARHEDETRYGVTRDNGEKYEVRKEYYAGGNSMFHWAVYTDEGGIAGTFSSKKNALAFIDALPEHPDWDTFDPETGTFTAPEQPAKTRVPLSSDDLARVAQSHGFTDHADPTAWQYEKDAAVQKSVMDRLGIPFDPDDVEHDVVPPLRVMERDNITLQVRSEVPTQKIDKVAGTLAALSDIDPIPAELNVIVRPLNNDTEFPDAIVGAFAAPATQGRNGRSGTGALMVIPPSTLRETGYVPDSMAAASDHSLIEYVVAHEYGHARFDGDPTTIEFPPAHILKYLSRYGHSSPGEAYAEAYAQWMLGDDNEASRWYAEKYNWPMPTGPRVTVNAAKEPPTRKRKPSSKKTVPPLIEVDTDKVVETLGGLDKWAYQCHAASVALVQSGVLGDSRVARGQCPGVGGQHSWVVLGHDAYDPNATIVDPTLWSYDPSVKGVWVGRASDRPHVPKGAGSIWQWGQPQGRGGKPIEIADTSELSSSAKLFLEMLGPLDIDGWVNLFSNAPVGGWPAGEIIEAAYNTDELRALIPIDIVGMNTDINPDGMYLATPEIPPFRGGEVSKMSEPPTLRGTEKLRADIARAKRDGLDNVNVDGIGEMDVADAADALSDIDTGAAVASWQADNGSGYVNSLRNGAADLVGKEDTFDQDTGVGYSGKYERLVAKLLRDRAEAAPVATDLYRGLYSGDRETPDKFVVGGDYSTSLSSWTNARHTGDFFATGEFYDIPRNGVIGVVLHAPSMHAFAVEDDDEGEYIGYGDFTIASTEVQDVGNGSVVYVELVPKTPVVSKAVEPMPIDETSGHTTLSMIEARGGVVSQDSTLTDTTITADDLTISNVARDRMFADEIEESLAPSHMPNVEGSREGWVYSNVWPTVYLNAATTDPEYQKMLHDNLRRMGFGDTVTIRRRGKENTGTILSGSLFDDWQGRGYGDEDDEVITYEVPMMNIVGFGSPAEGEVFFRPPIGDDSDIFYGSMALDVLQETVERSKVSGEPIPLIQLAINDPDLLPYIEARAAEIGWTEKMTEAVMWGIEHRRGRDERWMRADEVWGKGATYNVREYFSHLTMYGTVMTAQPYDVAAKILTEGRIKSQFETSTSNGVVAKNTRSEAEAEMFGLHPDVNPEKRPIYGYVGTNKLTPLNVECYGEVRFELKPDVKRRTTATIGDSLDAEKVPLSMDPYRSMTVREAFDAASEHWVIDAAQKGADAVDSYEQYDVPEAQIHGGVTLDDVAAIHLPMPSSTARVVKRNADGMRVSSVDPADRAHQKRIIDMIVRLAGEKGIPVYRYNSDGTAWIDENDPVAVGVVSAKKSGDPLPDAVMDEYDAFMDDADVSHGTSESFVVGRAREWRLSKEDAQTLSEGLYMRRVDREYRDTRWEQSNDIEHEQVGEFVRAAQGDEGELLVGVNAFVLGRIVEDGRLKSQFETQSSGGIFNPRARAEMETAKFLSHPSMDPKKRPIYGYVGVTYSATEGPSQYGEFRLRLKDSVRDRTTITVGDSLGGHAKPIPLTGQASDREAWGTLTSRGYSHAVEGESALREFEKSNYIEAQIHGGVALDDIDGVWMPTRWFATYNRWVKDGTPFENDGFPEDLARAFKWIRDNDIMVWEY